MRGGGPLPLRRGVRAAVLRPARRPGATRRGCQGCDRGFVSVRLRRYVGKGGGSQEAISGGAVELDIVMNISKFLSGEFDYVADELATLVQEVSVVAMNNGLNDVVVKVIVETAYLSDKMATGDPDRGRERRGLHQDLDRVRPSWSYSRGRFRAQEEAPEGLAVKASGGIRTLDDALDMLNAGASRLGMSSSVAVMKEAEGGGLQE